MKPLLVIGVVAVALWWLTRRVASAPAATNAPNGTAPDANGETSDGSVPGSVPTAFNPPEDRNNDPVVKIAQAVGLDSSIIPVPTVAEAVARSTAAAGAADTLRSLGRTMQVWDSNAGPIGLDGRHVGAFVTVPAPSAGTIDWNATQQQSVAESPYYASTGYYGDAAAVAGQMACGAKASGNAMGRVLDSSFCKGGPHFGADPQLSTGVWP